jgi:hypothetical protein
VEYTAQWGANELYSPFIRVIKSRRRRWAGHLSRMGKRRSAHRILMGRLGGRRPIGRPKNKWQ